MAGGGDMGALNWNLEITKHNQRLFKEHEAKQKKQSNIPAWNGDIESLFNDIVLTQEHVDKMANTRFLIPNIIAQGHITVYAAPANGGKSALFRYFCEILGKDGMKVFYVNVDAGPGDLKKHFAHAKTHNYKVIAPDACEGKSADDVTELLRTIADGGAQCSEYVFILDTLKKFTDVINKTKAKEFYKLLRKLTVQGATICLLGHCNKYKDEDGKHIYEGTADLRNDIDNLIYLDSFLNEQTNILEVTTRPDKVRAEFNPVSFNIDKNNSLKVTMTDKIINILPDEDREIIDLAKLGIADGNESQGEIIGYIKERLNGIGDRKIKSKLKLYSTGPRAELKATNTGLGRGLKYECV